MQRSSSATTFLLRQRLVSFAPLSKSESEDRSGTGSYLEFIVIQSTHMAKRGHKGISFSPSNLPNPISINYNL